MKKFTISLIQNGTFKHHYEIEAMTFSHAKHLAARAFGNAPYGLIVCSSPDDKPAQRKIGKGMRWRKAKFLNLVNMEVAKHGD